MNELINKIKDKTKEMHEINTSLITRYFNVKRDLLKLSASIIEASMYWTGEDEKYNPKLKTIRTLAAYHLAKGAK